VLVTLGALVLSDLVSVTVSGGERPARPTHLRGFRNLDPGYATRPSRIVHVVGRPPAGHRPPLEVVANERLGAARPAAGP